MTISGILRFICTIFNENIWIAQYESVSDTILNEEMLTSGPEQVILEGYPHEGDNVNFHDDDKPTDWLT